ncbi:AAA family ATPase [Roseomonas genomospecies 6]|uniref:ATP-dependent Clp protease ATP-binding subunit n=1 Tax=Roseomonas genomospecies 6 TaxID=214106 RepID=A0A9W7KQG8_9PROT|nr:AAA family ATPase [Roseomonas genomospecies 6]KAA0677657.1 ATP-dependent Clp protease ATP-binding subunit [Roseomonas genomospecies 6]
MDLMNNPNFMSRLQSKMEQKQAEKDTRKWDAATIAAKIKTRVIGQDHIADYVSQIIARKAARRVKKGTIINLMISGVTGTGKSETAKAIAEAMFGSEDYMLQIDCGNLGTGEAALASLVGSAAVYSGSSRGVIADYLIKMKGEGVILFDEFEKACPTKDAPVAKMLLKLLDEAKFQDQYSMQSHSASGCVIILTSNLKAKELSDAAQQITDGEELEVVARRVLSDTMAPEFMERLDVITTTRGLTTQDRARIVMLHFQKLAKSHECEVVDVGDGFFDLLVEGAERFGQTSTRGVIRWLGKVCDDAFIECVNDRKIKRVVADFVDGQLILTPAGAAGVSAAAPTPVRQAEAPRASTPRSGYTPPAADRDDKSFF